MRWVQEVDEAWVRALPIPKEQYGRHVVRDDDEAEIIACTWTRGEGTPLHGHGSSQGVTYVVEGTLLEERFIPFGAGAGFKHEVRRIEAGAWAHHPLGLYHRVYGATKARSIQCTVPPLEDPLAPVPADVWPRLDAARTRTMLQESL
jgi:hypothetical protein